MLDPDMTLDVDTRSEDHLLVQGAWKEKHASFDCKLIEEEEKHQWVDVGVRPVCDAQSTIPTALILPQLQHLASMGEDLCIEPSKDSLKLSIINDGEISSSITFGPSVVTNVVNQIARVTVSMSTIRKLFSLFKLAPHVSFYVHEGRPLEIEIHAQSILNVNVFVAPKEF
jgi:hypothetical protein